MASRGAAVPRLLVDKDELYLSAGSGAGVKLLPSSARLQFPAGLDAALDDSKEEAPLRRRRKAKKEKRDTAGAEWGHMAAPQMTAELKRELQIVRMRNVLDPKRFYRASDMKKELPKYFQMGTLVAGAADGASARLTRKQQKTSMIDELLAEPALRQRAKRRFQAVQDANSAGVRKTNRPAHGRKGKRRKE